MSKIKKAIFPVAGFGTRFLPATKAQPKEMLPVVDKPAIQYLVEEAVEAGIEEIIFVTGRGKRSIEDHFDHSFELEHTLVEKNKHDLLRKVREISEMAKFSYVRQPLPLGNGHAVKCASHLVEEDEPVLVMFGDTLYDYKDKSPSQQVIEAFEEYGNPIIGLSEIEKNETDKFGVVDGKKINDSIFDVKGFVEKPKPEDAPTNLAAVGVYVITPDIMDILNKTKEGRTGEIGLDDAFYALLEDDKKLLGRKLDGEWLDTGNKFNFIKATLKLGLKDKEISGDLKKYINELNEQI